MVVCMYITKKCLNICNIAHECTNAWTAPFVSTTWPKEAAILFWVVALIGLLSETICPPWKRQKQCTCLKKVYVLYMYNKKQQTHIICNTYWVHVYKPDWSSCETASLTVSCVEGVVSPESPVKSGNVEVMYMCRWDTRNSSQSTQIMCISTPTTCQSKQCSWCIHVIVEYLSEDVRIDYPVWLALVQWLWSYWRHLARIQVAS